MSPVTKERIIFNESFNYPDGELPAIWWSEGDVGRIKDGRLFVDADKDSLGVSTVWLDREFSGDVRVEFDAHIVSSRDTANNINCFLFYSDPRGRDLRASKEDRASGAYKYYHSLNGYIFTYLANGNPEEARVRLRFNPGFELLDENFGYECKTGTTYRVQITRKNNHFEYRVNGKELTNTVGKQAVSHEAGLFGFRTWHTCLWWDNLVITQLE